MNDVTITQPRTFQYSWSRSLGLELPTFRRRVHCFINPATEVGYNHSKEYVLQNWYTIANFRTEEEEEWPQTSLIYIPWIHIIDYRKSGIFLMNIYYDHNYCEIVWCALAEDKLKVVCATTGE